MSKKKSSRIAADATPKLKGGKTKEFPHIAEALNKPLDASKVNPEANGEATPPKATAKAEAKPKKEKPQKEKKAKKVSALDAAVRVLEEAGQPMGAKEMIDMMASKGYWSSPNGQTPHATLYAAILREIKVKGKEARFKKTEKGKFAATK